MARATGGTITTDGNYAVHTFTTSGTFTPDATLSEVAVLVVAGGGGGGGANAGNAGGGGGGGVIYNANFAVTPSTGVTVTIGGGGAAGTTGSGTAGSKGTNGGNSVFGALTAIGGGGGGIYTDVTPTNANGVAGGSGGGAGQYTSGTGGSATSGQGYAGGNTTGDRSGAGGGGAGGVGADGGNPNPGNGGIGYYSSINGTATYYAGGGGGSAHSTYTVPGNGGLGGGGNGRRGTTAGVAGTANTGGGGGGGGEGYAAGAGGSGIVIVRYLDIQLPTVTTSTPAGSIDSNSATGGGNVTDAGHGTISERGIVWGTSTNPTIAGNKQASGSGTGAFSGVAMTGLTPDTHYYYRAYATNEAGTAYGSNVEFDTLDAVISGTCTLAGSPVAGAIVTLIDSATDTVVATDTSDGSGNYAFNGLDVTKTYHVVAEYEDSPDQYNAKSLPFMTPEEI